MDALMQSDSQISSHCSCSLMSHNLLLKSDENALNFSRSSSEGEESEIEIENRILRNKVWDLELKQRQYISKILNLETCLAKLNLDINQKKDKKSRLSIETNLENGVPLIEINENKKNKNSNQSKRQKEKEREDSKRGTDEKKFCEVIIKTYKQLFGMSSLKQIWKKHKQILGEWLFSEGAQKTNKQ